jgi:tripartite-type tricarboxylate transporter receptor subunit TctC
MKIVLAALLLFPTFAKADDYPNRPIRMIVPLAAASSVDNAARIVTQKMTESLGHQITIINQPGASGVIGADQVARALPDGYTLGGFNDSILTMVPVTLPKVPWDPIRDFAPISLVGTIEFGLVATNATPYSDVAGLIAAARKAPNTITYGSGGIGSPQHIAMVVFAEAAGIKLRHIPYRGATQAAIDIAGGQIDIGFQGLPAVAELVRGKQMKLLGVASDQALPQFPAAPVIAATQPGFHFSTWFAIVAPAKTPQPILDRLNAEIVKAVADPEIQQKLTAQGFTVTATTPAILRATTERQLVTYRKVVQDAGIALPK